MKDKKHKIAKKIFSELDSYEVIRTSYGLWNEAEESYHYLTENVGMNAKTIFNLIAENKLGEIFEDELKGNETIVGMIEPFIDNPTKRKTFAITKSAQAAIDKWVVHYNIPRDAYVSFSMWKLGEVYKYLIDKERAAAEEVIQELEKISFELENLQSKAFELFGQDDPLALRIGTPSVYIDNLVDDITKFVKTGEKVEFD